MLSSENDVGRSALEAKSTPDRPASRFGELFLKAQAVQRSFGVTAGRSGCFRGSAWSLGALLKGRGGASWHVERERPRGSKATWMMGFEEDLKGNWTLNAGF